jgi:activating signal cointegrator complex subunit 3
MIIDEIHLLGVDRGPVLEVIVSRMRFISAQTAKPIRLELEPLELELGLALGSNPNPNLDLNLNLNNNPNPYPNSKPIRFVGLSTALANPRDLADWLGIGNIGVYNFRPSVRPIPMTIHIQVSVRVRVRVRVWSNLNL